MSKINNTEILFAKHSCRIVFVKDHTAGAQLSAQLTKEHPEYRSEISERFASTKKVGPFRVKNKQSLYNIYLKTKAIKTVLTEDGRETADRDIKVKMDLMDLRGYEDRYPKTLSNLQRLRASILCDILDGKSAFIISDCSDQQFDSTERRLNFKNIYLTIARFMKNSDDFEWVPCNLIWISDTNSDEMLTMLGEEDYRSDFYSFYQIENGCIAELDRETLIKGFTPIQIAPAVSEAPATKEEEPVREAKKTKKQTDAKKTSAPTEYLRAKDLAEMTPRPNRTICRIDGRDFYMIFPKPYGKEQRAWISWDVIDLNSGENGMISVGWSRIESPRRYSVSYMSMDYRPGVTSYEDYGNVTEFGNPLISFPKPEVAYGYIKGFKNKEDQTVVFTDLETNKKYTVPREFFEHTEYTKACENAYFVKAFIADATSAYVLDFYKTTALNTLQYLYNIGESAMCMDMETYEQYEISMRYLPEGIEEMDLILGTCAESEDFIKIDPSGKLYALHSIKLFDEDSLYQ
ncbi:MAG: hypothetical protein IKM48_07440 [Clostridia bacterium]|nr:hypothetical protein [Clostridia bacterium]